MLSIEQTGKAILSSLSPLSAIKKPLDESLGFYLSCAIAAERDYPAFDRITHDGMVINFSTYADRYAPGEHVLFYPWRQE
jgi:molybdopterin biosynthesis enzyme